MAPQPFASLSDLQGRLGRTFDAAQTEQVMLLLEDASAYLRAQIGWQVFPPATGTVRLVADWSGMVDVPQPATVTAVLRDGRPVAGWQARPGGLERLTPGPIDVTVQVGYAAPPAELVAWTCVLASQQLQVADELGALGASGTSSVQIDDYRRSYADAGADSGLALPARVLDRLRAVYGAGAYVSGT